MEFFSDASAPIHVESSRPGASRCQLRIPRELRRRRCPRGFLGALVMGVDPRLAGAGPKQPELPGNSSGKQPQIPLENGPATFHFPDFPAFPGFPAVWRWPGELGVGRVIPGLDIGSDSLPGTNSPSLGLDSLRMWRSGMRPELGIGGLRGLFQPPRFRDSIRGVGLPEGFPGRN